MAGSCLARHDETYVRLHNQHQVRTGQYIPPVPRGMIDNTMDLMRFRERIENEEGAVAQWHNAFGRWNWTNKGELSEYAQRSFNLSGQIHEPSEHRPFFESLIRRRGPRGGGQAENPEESYTRQTGLHFRRPLACESSFRLHNIDRSTATTPESAGGRAKSAEGIDPRRVNHRVSIPYYLRDRKFAENWHPFSEPNLRCPGVNAAWRRAEH